MLSGQLPSELEQTTAQASTKTFFHKECPLHNKTYFCYIIFQLSSIAEGRHTTFKSWPTIERKPKSFNQHFVTAKKKSPNNPGLDPALWWIVDGKFKFTQWGALWCSEAGFKQALEDLMSTLWSQTLRLSKLSRIRGNLFYLETMQTDVFILQFSMHHRMCYKVLVQAKRRHKAQTGKLLKYKIVN